MQQLNTDNGAVRVPVRREYTSLKALTLSFSHFSLLCSPAWARSGAVGSPFVRLESGRCAEGARWLLPPAAGSANPMSPRVIERARPPAQAEDDGK